MSTRWISLRWFPARGRRCHARLDRSYAGRRYFDLGIGPLYFKLGPGTPRP